MWFKRIVLFRSCTINMRNTSNSFAQFNYVKSLQRLKTSNKSVLFTTAVAIGLSAYLIHKNKVNCDIVKEIETDCVKKNIQDLIDFEDDFEKDYEDAINKSRDILQRLKDKIGIPGIIIGVSVDGKTVWTEGLGYANLENRVLCSEETVMRIASISKSITMAAVAKLMEKGLLDLDKPVQEYVPSFPQKSFEGKPVVITTRHLVSHLSGIRHYHKPSKNSKDTNNKEKYYDPEIYNKEKHNMESSLKLFKDDPLCFGPGKKFLYSTFGWTLISAVIEAVTKEDFQAHMECIFKRLGMKHTYFDENDLIIYNRSSYYVKDKKGYIMNAPYVDNSYKWAGGGFLSTVPDLLRFGNIMLYSFQFNEERLKQKDISKKQLIGENHLPGYLKQETMRTIWRPVTACSGDCDYAMGWVSLPEKQECQFCAKLNFCILHTGDAVGASSVLLIKPSKINAHSSLSETLPKGIIVSIMANLKSVNLSSSAIDIAKIFESQQQK